MEKYLNSILMKNATEIIEQPIRLAPLAQKLTNATKVSLTPNLTSINQNNQDLGPGLD
jgi:hypothetical protein